MINGQFFFLLKDLLNLIKHETKKKKRIKTFPKSYPFIDFKSKTHTQHVKLCQSLQITKYVIHCCCMEYYKSVSSSQTCFVNVYTHFGQHLGDEFYPDFKKENKNLCSDVGRKSTSYKFEYICERHVLTQRKIVSNISKSTY